MLWLKMKLLQICPRRFYNQSALLMLLLRTSKLTFRQPACRSRAIMLRKVKKLKASRSRIKYHRKVQRWKCFGQNAKRNSRRKKSNKRQPGHGKTSTSSNHPRNVVRSEFENARWSLFCYLNLWLISLPFLNFIQTHKFLMTNKHNKNARCSLFLNSKVIKWYRHYDRYAHFINL